MKNIIHPTLALAALLLSSAAMAGLPAPVQDALDNDSVALDIIEGLTTEVGPRLAATEAEARARAWAVPKLKSLGFSNVRIEEYQMPTWIRGEEKGWITAPFPQKLALTALGNSGATPPEGLEAEVVYFASIADLEAAPDNAAAGKIVFVDHEMRATQDGSSYGFFGQARRRGPDVASKKGALAMVIRSIGTDYHRNPHTGGTNFTEGTKPIPAAALSIPDAENLERIFKRGKPVKMKLVLTPQNIGQQTSGNVISELPGSNKALPPIVIACHLDSWDLGTGAIDDAAGCGIITAAAKRVTKPKRTIRLLWAGAEEVGVFGGKAYGEKYKAEPHALAMESDFGADRVWAAKFKLPESAKPLKDSLTNALAAMGIGIGQGDAGGGADVGPISAAQNLAIIDLEQDGTRYFDVHHTPDDTFDKIDPAQLRQNVAAWLTVLQLAADYEGDLAMPVPVPKP